MMLKVDARGDACPLPVVKAKKAISELKGAGEVEVLVDNEIAVQNLTKMAQQKGYQYSAEKLAEREYRVLFTVGEASETPTVHRTPARTRWLPSALIKWALAQMTLASPCSRPLCSHLPSRISCPKQCCSITAARP